MSLRTFHYRRQASQEYSGSQQKGEDVRLTGLLLALALTAGCTNAIPSAGTDPEWTVHQYSPTSPAVMLPRVVAVDGVWAVTDPQVPSPIGLTVNWVNAPAAFRGPSMQRSDPTAISQSGADPGASSKVDVPMRIEPAELAVGAV